MADVTGAIHREFSGRSYTLRLTSSGLAALQGRHGLDIGGLLSGTGLTGVPPFAILLDIVAEAVKKGEGLSHDEAEQIADELLTADQQIVGEILAAAFPDTSGNVKAPAKRRR